MLMVEMRQCETRGRTQPSVTSDIGPLSWAGEAGRWCLAFVGDIDQRNVSLYVDNYLITLAGKGSNVHGVCLSIGFREALFLG
jgi:hypothetical protein